MAVGLHAVGELPLLFHTETGLLLVEAAVAGQLTQEELLRKNANYFAGDEQIPSEDGAASSSSSSYHRPLAPM